MGGYTRPGQAGGPESLQSLYVSVCLRFLSQKRHVQLPAGRRSGPLRQYTAFTVQLILAIPLMHRLLPCYSAARR